MVFVTALSSKFNKSVAPFLLRNGLSARYILGWGVVKDNPFLDSLLLLPLVQKVISIEIQDEAIALTKERAEKIGMKKDKSTLDQFFDRVWDRYLEPIYPAEKHTEDGNDKNIGALNPRLDILEAHLRPAIAPNDEWIDIERWKFNQRFQKWVRHEYLVAKYGSDMKEALRLHPILKVSSLQQRERQRRDSLFGFLFGGSASNKMIARNEKLQIPSSKSLIKAFSLENWNRTKMPLAERQSIEEIAKRIGGNVENLPGTSIVIPDIPDEADISSLSLEEILEIGGCHVAKCGVFNAFCEEADIYEFWTKEYISGLASYLLDRSENYEKGNTVVLDIGSGDGALAHHLRKSMEKKYRAKNNTQSKTLKRGEGVKKNSKKERTLPKVIATDNGSWRIKSQADLERLDVVESMKKYGKSKENEEYPVHQLIVLCSWMPMGEDWTKEFRDGGADEYILIGECDDGNCGHNWLTWGNKAYYLSNPEKASEKTSLVPPYISDGFVRYNMEYLSKMQFSRFDSSVSSASKTVSFRKKGHEAMTLTKP